MKYPRTILLLILLAFMACRKEEVDISNNDNSLEEDKVMSGYNIRWRGLPDFDDSAIMLLVDSLSPDLLRYPGGTMTHKWNWQTGLINDPPSVDFPHPISDLKRLTEASHAKAIFVLDIVNRSLEDQISMLEAANMSIEYIEMGNELYADDYEEQFPNGAAYADLVNSWVPELRNKFPEAKIGAVMLGRTAGNDRKNTWNQQVHESISVDIDAYIYHIYTNETESVTERIARFDLAFIPNSGKELWITEYGVRSQNIVESLELSNWVDSVANISLNHCILARSGNFSKTTLDGNELTEEGKAFVEKYY